MPGKQPEYLYSVKSITRYPAYIDIQMQDHCPEKQSARFLAQKFSNPVSGAANFFGNSLPGRARDCKFFEWSYRYYYRRNRALETVCDAN